MDGAANPHGGMIHDEQTFAAYVLTTNRAKVPRTQALETLYVAFLRVLFSQETWADLRGSISSPKEALQKNLYTKALDQMGIGLWGVRWCQTLQYPITDPEDLNEFLRMYADYVPAGDPDGDPIQQQIDTFQGAGP